MTDAITLGTLAIFYVYIFRRLDQIGERMTAELGEWGFLAYLGALIVGMMLGMMLGLRAAGI